MVVMEHQRPRRSHWLVLEHQGHHQHSLVEEHQGRPHGPKDDHQLQIERFRLVPPAGAAAARKNPPLGVTAYMAIGPPMQLHHRQVRSHTIPGMREQLIGVRTLIATGDLQGHQAHETTVIGVQPHGLLQTGAARVRALGTPDHGHPVHNSGHAPPAVGWHNLISSGVHMIAKGHRAHGKVAQEITIG